MSLSLQLTGEVNVHKLERRLISAPPQGRPLSLPTTTYAASVNLEHYLDNGLGSRRSGAKFYLYNLKNAKVVIGGSNGSLLLTQEGKIVLEPSCFTDIAARTNREYPLLINVEGSEGRIPSAALTFDRSWSNYYHWLIFALGRGRLLHDNIALPTPVILPTYASAQRDVRFSEATYQSSLAHLMLSIPTLTLNTGVYVVDDLYFMWTEPAAPTDVVEAPDFIKPFEQVARQLVPNAAASRLRRLYFSRRRGGDWRITDEEQSRLDGLLERYKFETVYLEELTFEQQVTLSATAEIIMAPHGAGLANLLFAPSDTLVIELNRRLANETKLRPWFYQIASVKQQRYVGIDMDMDEKFDSLEAVMQDLVPA